jgi:CRISPR/Cas system-associated exonuclease Cas4 (RecB family)
MQPSPSSHSKSLTPIIRASEISQFVFCQRAWWLGSVQGYRPVNDAAMSAGTRAHHQHGRSVAASQRWQRVGYVLFAIAVVLGAVVLWGALGGGQ